MRNQLYQSCRIGMLAFLALTCGCGGGGGGGGGGGAASGAGSVQQLAPQSASGRSLELRDANGLIHSVEFAANGDTFTQVVTATRQNVKSGTYSYAPADRTATVTLTDAANNEVTTINLSFETETSGTYRFSTNSGNAGSGTFANFVMMTVAPPPAGGSGSNTGTGTGSTGNTGAPPASGTPPPSGAGGLDGRVIALVRSTGQTHTYTFTANRFTDSDPPEEGSGTYTFSRSGSQATLTLMYTGSSGPVNLAGDRHDIQMSFTSETRGTYSSTYTVNDGSVLSQTGTFEFLK